jgi:HSP20 family protein
MPRVKRLQAVISVRRDIDELFESFFGSDQSDAVFEPPVDVFVSDNKVHIMAEVPGVDAHDIHIRISARSVHLLGVKRVPDKVRRGVSFYESQIPYGGFEKRVVLPFPVDPDSVAVELKDGLLDIELGRAGSGARIIRVE